MGRKIGAGIVGVVVAMALVWLVQLVGHTVYSPPADMDINDLAAMTAYIETLPIGAFLFVIGSYFIGTFGGTFLACRIAGSQPMLFAGLVGGLMFIATAMNVAMIPHPTWFVVAAIVAIIVAAWLGQVPGSRPARQDD